MTRSPYLNAPNDAPTWSLKNEKMLLSSCTRQNGLFIGAWTLVSSANCRYSTRSRISTRRQWVYNTLASFVDAKGVRRLK